jgi:cytochrome c2
MGKKTLLIIVVIFFILIIWFFISPPQFVLNLVKPVDMSDPTVSGKALIVQYDCTSCHQISGEGRSFGPELNGVTRRMTMEELQLWLLNPGNVKPGTAMPDLNLSDQEALAIISYLQSIDR